MNSLRRVVVILFALAFVRSATGAPVAATLRSSAVPARPAIASRLDSRVALNVDDPALAGSVVFTDAMKQASPWTSDRALLRDDDGNVKALLAGQAAQTVIYPFAAYPSGDYTLLYDGRGALDVDPRSGSVTSAAPGRAIVHITARPGIGIRLRLTATDPGNYLRNIRLILPGFENAYQNQPFAPAFLTQVASFGVVRFVHWSHGDTSAAPLSWPLRPTVTQFTQAGASGVAWEYQIALANATGADPWFVVPAGATNFYITQLAALVHARLDPRLHPMFEYADGAWRSGSPVNAYATLAGRNFRLALDAQSAALAWYSLRSTQLFSLVQNAFGADAGRIVRVLSGAPALPQSAADRTDRTILAGAGVAQRADIFAIDATGATPEELASLRSLLTGTRVALAASGGALSFTGPRDAQAATSHDLEVWRAAGGGLFAVSSLTAYLASTGLLTRVTVEAQAQIDALRDAAIASYERLYPAAHTIPRPLAAASVLAPLAFPNTYLQTAAPAPALTRVAASAASRRAAARPLAATSGIAIDAGGPAVSGTNWIADADFSGGYVSSGTKSAIATGNVSSPAPQAVYQTSRVGTSFSYTIPDLTPAAAYTVRLHFAETFWNARGKRVFNVSVNGTQALSNFDVFAAAGGEFVAVIEPVNTVATASGTISVAFARITDNALISGIEVVPGGTATPTPTPTPTLGAIDINSGGPAVAGTAWIADSDGVGGRVTGTTAAIVTTNAANPAPAQVYQSSRVGTAFSYTIPGLTPSANYTVRLHFAETFWPAAGKRLFNVAVNATPVLASFDIFKAAGGKNIAVVEQTGAVASAGGTIAIGFTAVTDNALISGIEIDPAGGSTPTPTPTPMPTPTPTATPVPADVPQYHNDAQRTGWNRSEALLTPATVASSKFGLRQILAVDGLVMAQPLYVANYPVGGTNHNLLIVATEHDTVYAFDAGSGAVLWQQSLGTSQTTADVGCTDIEPEYGITSTPAIDRGSGTLFVVAATEPSAKTLVTQLHALDLGTGLDKVAPVHIAASAVQSNGSTIAFSDAKNMQRASLLLANNSVYLGFGSHCDYNSGTTSGWLMRYSLSLAQLAAFNTVEDGVASGTQLASIWGSGFGPAADTLGNVYAVTGNGAFDASPGGHNYAMSVLRFAPDLAGGVQDWFAYKGLAADNLVDADFGSAGTMLIPALSGAVPNTLVAMGKSASMYLLDQTNLGKFSSTDAGALQVVSVGAYPHGLWGGPAYYNVPGGGPTVYYQINAQVMKAYRVTTGSGAPQLSLASSGTTTTAYGGTIPVVSSNGGTAGSGVVWALRRVDHSPAASSVTLDAYDASNLANHLYAQPAGTWSHEADNCFVTPLVAGGKVYAGAYKTVYVFGLSP